MLCRSSGGFSMRPRGWVARSCVDGKLKIKPCNAAIDKAKKSVGTFSFDYCTLTSMGFHLTVFWDLKWICSTPSLPKDQADLVYRTCGCGVFFPKAFCVPSCFVLVCWDLCLGSWNNFSLGFDWDLWSATAKFGSALPFICKGKGSPHPRCSWYLWADATTLWAHWTQGFTGMATHQCQRSMEQCVAAEGAHSVATLWRFFFAFCLHKLCQNMPGNC